MSGGAAVKAGDGGKGDHPVCTERRGGRSGKRPGDALKGLALTARGRSPLLLKKSGRSPQGGTPFFNFEEEKSQPQAGTSTVCEGS